MTTSLRLPIRMGTRAATATPKRRTSPRDFRWVLVHALTSIVDEHGSLYGTFKYNANGHILSTDHALGAQRYQFTRDIGTTTVTDPLAAMRTFTYQVVDRLQRITATSGPAGAGVRTALQG